MSGGSWQYFYEKVEDVAYNLSSSKCPYRIAFSKHLLDIAQALHDIEWVDSNDYSPGDEVAAIKKCISDSRILENYIQEAHEVADNLNNLINQQKISRRVRKNEQ